MGEPIRVVGCFVECEGRFLILKRSDKASHEPGAWGIPAGKVEEDEDDLQALIREVKEESGHVVDPERVDHLIEDTWIVSKRAIRFVAFRECVSTYPEVKIRSEEHGSFRWVTPQECAEQTDLIEGLHDLMHRVGYLS